MVNAVVELARIYHVFSDGDSQIAFGKRPSDPPKLRLDSPVVDAVPCLCDLVRVDAEVAVGSVAGWLAVSSSCYREWKAIVLLILVEIYLFQNGVQGISGLQSRCNYSSTSITAYQLGMVGLGFNPEQPEPVARAAYQKPEKSELAEAFGEQGEFGLAIEFGVDEELLALYATSSPIEACRCKRLFGSGGAPWSSISR